MVKKKNIVKCEAAAEHKSVDIKNSVFSNQKMWVRSKDCERDATHLLCLGNVETALCDEHFYNVIHHLSLHAHINKKK